MNREDLDRLAVRAGFPERSTFSDLSDIYPRIERFAALVRADERNRIISANQPEIENVNAHIKALEDELKALREPLTGEEMTEGCRSLGVGSFQTLAAAFEAGVRFAEAAIRARKDNT